MLAQSGSAVIFYAHFLASNVSATGLTVTIDVWEIQRDGTATEIVTAGSATEIGDGIYRYLLAAGSVDAAAEYIGVFKTSGTADQKHIPSMWVVDRRISADVTAISGDETAANNLESYTDGTTPQPVNVTQISGDAAAADNLELAADGTGYNLGGGQVVAASVTGAVGSVTGNVGGNVAGSVGSVTGAVGSVTGNVGGNVVGSVGSLGTQAKTDVRNETTTALETYDPPTRTEATADKDEILAKTPDSAHWTPIRAGYLDNANVGGLLASQSDITAITQAQRVRVVLPPQFLRPGSGEDPVTYRIWIYSYNETHTAEDLDDLPVVTAENNTGTDRSANLGTVTKVAATTGRYYVDYTVADDHDTEGLVLKVDATEGGTTTQYPASTVVVDAVAVDFTAADRTNLETLLSRVPGSVALEATLTALKGAGWTTETLKAIKDAVDLKLAASAYTAPDNAGIAAILEDTATTLPGLIDALPTATEIDTELTANHGAGSWAAGGGLTGAFTITRTLRNASTLATLEGALVTIKNGAGTILDQKRTDENGQVSISLDAGSYTISARLAGYTSIADQALAVSADSTGNLDLTPISVGSSGDADLCRVYSYERTGSDQAVSGRIVKAKLINLPVTTATGILEGETLAATTDANGYWYLDLVIGATYQLTITKAGVNHKITIPDEESVNARTLL